MPVKTSKQRTLCLLFLILSASLLLPGHMLAGKKASAPAPGLYNLNGWQGARYGVDINGEVGHPLYVAGPTARCEPSRQWGANATVDTGSLPPGMTMDATASNITGIPTKRGHWIVTMRLGTVNCGGSTYEGFTQELRFHITGTGEVIQ